MQPATPTVFVVDDDEGVRNSLRFLLKSVGLNTRAMASAREFLEAFKQNQAGCLVLDVRMRAIEADFGIDFSAYFQEALARLQAHIADGLIVIGDGRITVTAMGRLLLRSIAMCFDTYLQSPAAAEGVRPTFSRVV